jgi:predicted nucleic acid-binding protein
MTVAKPIFLDTGFAIALLSPRDQFHSAARRLAAELRTDPARIVTTDAVIFEIGAALAKQAWRPAAIRFIKALRADPNVEIVATDPVLWQAAFDLFGARTDKEWSLTDCLSFVVMSRRDLTNALAADEHFRQAGFSAAHVGRVSKGRARPVMDGRWMG